MKKSSTTLSMVLPLVLLTAAPALAADGDLGGIADRIGRQAGMVGNAFGIFVAVAGVVVAMMGLLKFKAHSANPNDPSNKLSSAFIMVFVGAAMVALPEVLGTGVTTLFGEGATTISGTNVPKYLDL